MTRLLSRRAAVVGLFAVASALCALFLFGWPGSRRSAEASPPNDLPYTKVSYSTADAQHAFASVGVQLAVKAKASSGATLGDSRDAFEVDVFAAPSKVKASGFHDYLRSGDGYVRFPHACGGDLPDAERWRGNVRVVVSCASRLGSAAFLGRADRALAQLSE